MLISVIIPCYNAEDYVSECISSVLSQTYKNIEIICVNDGSTDKTLTVLNGLQKKYPEVIKVITTSNNGAPVARNLGLKKAGGEYIQFLDADDVLQPDKFEKQLSGFRDDSISVVVSDRVRKSNDLTTVIQEFNFSSIEINPLETAVTKIIITGNPLYKKKCVLELKGYDESLLAAQDWDFHIRLVLAGHKIAYVPGVFFISREVSGSISSNWIKVSIQAAAVIKGLRPSLLQHPSMNEDTKHYIAQLYMNTAVFCKDDSVIKSSVEELNHWSDKYYGFIQNPVKRFIARLIGIKSILGILRYINK